MLTGIVTIISRSELKEKLDILKPIAFTKAALHNSKPGQCSEPECREYIDLLSLTYLQEDEYGLLINNVVQKRITGSFILIPICFFGVVHIDLNVNQDRLDIIYNDGAIEAYEWVEPLQGWKYLYIR